MQEKCLRKEFFVRLCFRKLNFWYLIKTIRHPVDFCGISKTEKRSLKIQMVNKMIVIALCKSANCQTRGFKWHEIREWPLSFSLWTGSSSTAVLLHPHFPSSPYLPFTTNYTQAYTYLHVHYSLLTILTKRVGCSVFVFFRIILLQWWQNNKSL